MSNKSLGSTGTSGSLEYLRMAENIGPNSPNDDGGGIKEQDRLLPIANVGRIMKHILPPNAKISKEAKETMQECVSEFISFVTSEASEKCRKERRKTVNGDDVCWALATLGFDDYAVPLRRYLHKYREQEGEKAASQDNKANNSNSTEDKEEQLSYGRNQTVAQIPLKFNMIGSSSNNNSNLGPFN